MSHRNGSQQSRGRSAQPTRIYNPEINALSNLIAQASNNLNSIQSKSYAAKIKERQISRKNTSRDYDQAEMECLETPKNRIPPEPAPLHPFQCESNQLENILYKKDSESDKSIGIQEKLSTLNPSDISFEKKSSIYMSVDQDNLLSIVRDQEPKAEFRSPQSHFLSVSSKNSSPERCRGSKDLQYLASLEKNLTEQRVKYKKLEQKYKELLAKHSRSEEFYENAIQKLTSELNQVKGGNRKEVPAVQKVEENPVYRIWKEIDDIKQRLSTIEQSKQTME